MVDSDRSGRNYGVDFDDVIVIVNFVVLNNSYELFVAYFIAQGDNIGSLKGFNCSFDGDLVFEDFEFVAKHFNSLLEVFIFFDDDGINFSWNDVFSDDGIDDINWNLFLFDWDIPMGFLINMANDLNIFDSIGHD